MSQSSKQSVSGLSSVKRDFSSNTPIAGKPSSGSAPANAPAKKAFLSDAMRSAIAQGVAKHDRPLPVSQTLPQKRPSSQPEPPPSKRRQLPSSWTNSSSPSASYSTASTNSTRTFSRAPSSSSAFSSQKLSDPLSESTSFKESGARTIKPESSRSVSKSNGKETKPAPIFLSKEQRTILKMVEKGASIFYTGSAGESRKSSRSTSSRWGVWLACLTSGILFHVHRNVFIVVRY